MCIVLYHYYHMINFIQFLKNKYSQFANYEQLKSYEYGLGCGRAILLPFLLNYLFIHDTVRIKICLTHSHSCFLIHYLKSLWSVWKWMEMTCLMGTSYSEKFSNYSNIQYHHYKLYSPKVPSMCTSSLSEGLVLTAIVPSVESRDSRTVWIGRKVPAEEKKKTQMTHIISYMMT